MMTTNTSNETASHYNQTARSYEQRWAHYLQHTHQYFLKKITLRPNDCVLDLSCGTGLLAQHFIERGDNFGEIILNDIAKSMQKYAKKRLKHHTNITFTSFSANDIKLPDRRVDKICSLSAFHNYPQQATVLEECHRVLKPGGKLFILDWNNEGLFRIKNWLIRQVGSEHIDTRSARDMNQFLLNTGFETYLPREWRHRSWKFFYIIACKK